MRALIIPAVAAFLNIHVPVWAADYSDPTWPCMQRKVETLSLGLMWPLAVPEGPVTQHPRWAIIVFLASKL